jgi:hypothetical protein
VRGTQPVSVRSTLALWDGSSVLVAVILTLPGRRAVTRPPFPTVAFAGSSLDQVTDCETVDGVTVAESCRVDPTSSVVVGAVIETPVTDGVLLLPVGVDSHAPSISTEIGSAWRFPESRANWTRRSMAFPLGRAFSSAPLWAWGHTG